MHQQYRSIDWAWRHLGIAPTEDVKAIRKAYAGLLKSIDPDSDPEAFMRLREAVAIATRLAAGLAAARERGESGLDNEDDGADYEEEWSDAPYTPLSAVDETFLDQPQPRIVIRPVPVVDPEAAPAGPDAVIVGPAPDGEGGGQGDSGGDGEESGPSDPPPELLAAIDAQLYGSAESHDPARLAELTWELLAHPSLDRLRVAEGIEAWIFDTILRAAPRSDPMIDPAVARFAWEKKSTEWRAAPALHWILRRREDAWFEQQLVAADPRYGEALAALRTPEPPTPQQARRYGRDVREFMDLAGLHHPTSIDCNDRAATEWWTNHFRSRGLLAREGDALRNLFRRSALRRLAAPPEEDLKVGGLLLVGIFVAPYVFGWFTLRPGHSKLARIVTFVWMAFVVFALATRDDPPRSGAGVPASTYAGAPVSPTTFSPYRDSATDIGLELSRYDASNLDAAALERSNPALFARLTDLWRSNQQSNAPYSTFSDAAGTAIWDDYRAGLRGGDYEIQAAYWHLRADILTWMANDGSEGRSCDAYLNGTAPPLLHPVFVNRTNALVGRVLLRSGRRDVPDLAPGQTYRYDIPDAVFDGAMARSRLDRGTLLAALRGRGTPERRCVARIAFIQSALALPSMRMTPFLRKMSRGL